MSDNAAIWGPVSGAFATVIVGILVFLRRKGEKGDTSLDPPLAIFQQVLQDEIADRKREREEWQKEVLRLNQRILDLTGQRKRR